MTGTGTLGPWRIFRYQRETLHAPTLAAAKATADRVYRKGFVELEHETTGEDWARIGQSWLQRRPATPGHLKDEVA